MAKKRPGDGKTAAEIVVSEYRGKQSQFAKTRVFNDRAFFLAEVDERTEPAKRCKEIFNGHASDLGGRKHMSEAEYQLARRAAIMGAIAESMEALWVTGSTVFDLQEYLKLSNAQNRILSTLGLERRKVDMGTVDQLIDQVAKESGDAE